MKIVSFAKWLKLVIGEDWNYFDTNYSEVGVNQLYEEYEYYCENPEKYPECNKN